MLFKVFLDMRIGLTSLCLFLGCSRLIAIVLRSCSVLFWEFVSFFLVENFHFWFQTILRLLIFRMIIGNNIAGIYFVLI